MTMKECARFFVTVMTFWALLVDPAEATPVFSIEEVVAAGKEAAKNSVKGLFNTFNLGKLLGISDVPPELSMSYSASPNKFTMNFTGGAFEENLTKSFKGTVFNEVIDGNVTTKTEWWAFNFTIGIRDDSGSGTLETDIVATSGAVTHLVPFGGVVGDPLLWSLSIHAIDELLTDKDHTIRHVQATKFRDHRIHPNEDTLRNVVLQGEVDHILSGDVRHEFLTYGFGLVAEHVPEPGTLPLLLSGFALLVGSAAMKPFRRS